MSPPPARSGPSSTSSEARRIQKSGSEAQRSVAAKASGCRAASAPGFFYSAAFVEAGKGGLVWDEARVAELIADPAKFLGGEHRMRYKAITDPAERAPLILAEPPLRRRVGGVARFDLGTEATRQRHLGERHGEPAIAEVMHRVDQPVGDQLFDDLWVNRGWQKVSGASSAGQE